MLPPAWPNRAIGAPHRGGARSDEGDIRRRVTAGAETAFVVISLAEEYSVIGLQGSKKLQQALINKDGHSYDLLTVASKSGGKEESTSTSIALCAGRGEAQSAKVKAGRQGEAGAFAIGWSRNACAWPAVPS